jgi:hypothetical protein
MSDFCCPDYIITMADLVKQNWNGKQGRGRDQDDVHDHEGRALEGIRLETSSGFQALDNEAARALRVRGYRRCPRVYEPDAHGSSGIRVREVGHRNTHDDIRAFTSIGPGLTGDRRHLLVPASSRRSSRRSNQRLRRSSRTKSALGLSGSGAPPHYAVPDFIALTPGAAPIAQMLAQVLWDDLAFEREFDMMPRDINKTVAVARTPDQIPFGAWRENGADAVFFGTVEQKGNDVLVEVRLFNVRSRTSVFAQQYTIASRSVRKISHEVADAIHQQQRGVRGVARTRLTFVSDRVRESLLGTVEKRNAKEVYVVDYDGANEQRITNSRDLNLNPSWSSDARGIAYSAYRRGAAPEILVSLIYTGVLQNLTKGRFRDGAYLRLFSLTANRSPSQHC